MERGRRGVLENSFDTQTWMNPPSLIPVSLLLSAHPWELTLQMLQHLGYRDNSVASLLDPLEDAIQGC